MNDKYSKEELDDMNILCGKNVVISKKVSIYNYGKIIIGDNVRIDDYCILSGNISIGNNVHISAYTALFGKYGIEIGNFCGCSPRCTILSGTDDFSGEYMIGPMVSEELTNVNGQKVILENFSQIGANSILMPGVKIHEGAVCGCFSFVNHDLEEWTISAGIPTRIIKKRKKNVKNLERKNRYEKK